MAQVNKKYFFVSQKGNYYLVGFNHNKNCLWHYRLDYVKDVKILKELAKVRSETELNGKDIGKYVLEHPYMFAGTPKGIEVRVSADRLGIIHDTFGTAFTKIKDNGDINTTTVKVNNTFFFIIPSYKFAKSS